MHEGLILAELLSKMLFYIFKIELFSQIVPDFSDLLFLKIQSYIKAGSYLSSKRYRTEASIAELFSINFELLITTDEP